MGEIKINKCDICRMEVRSDKDRDKFYNRFGSVELNFKDHYYLQSCINKFICYGCAKKILISIENTIKQLKKGECK